MKGRELSVHATEDQARNRAARLSRLQPTKLYDVIYRGHDKQLGERGYAPFSWAVVEIDV